MKTRILSLLIVSLYLFGLGAQVIDVAPVAYWNFENAPSVLDETFQSQIGDIPTKWEMRSEFKAATIVDDTFGKCMSTFFKSPNVVTTAPDPLLGEANGSISIWFKPDNIGEEYSGLISHYHDNTDNWALNCSNHRIDFRCGGTNNYYADTVITNGNWYHLVATWAENADKTTSTCKLYINGAQQSHVISGAKSYRASTNASAVWQFGGERDNIGRQPKAMLDEILLFNVALPADSILKLYNETKNGTSFQTEFSSELTSVSLNKSTAELVVGASTTLTYTAAPLAAPVDAGFMWSSSDDNVATVSQSGEVTAIGAGVADISVSYNGDASIKDICSVTVISDDQYTYLIPEKAVAYWNFDNITANLGENFTSQIGEVGTSWVSYGGEKPAYLLAADHKDVFDKFGQNLILDFSAAHLITDRDPLLGTVDGTMSIWMCFRHVDNQYRGWLSHNNLESDNWAINTNGSTKVDFRCGGANNYYKDTALVADKWYHVAVTYEKSIDTIMVPSVVYTIDTTYTGGIQTPENMIVDTINTVRDTITRVDTVSYGKTYINGALQNHIIGKTDTNKRPNLYDVAANANAVWKFGEDRETKRRPRGQMDEVTMFEKALSAEQILALYEGGMEGQPYRIMALEGVSLLKETAALNEGKTVNLAYDMTPVNADAFKGFAWSTSDAAVATVDANGKVAAVGVGTASITLTYKGDASITDACIITVSALESVSIKSEDFELAVNADSTLSYEYAPEAFDLDFAFVWSSTDETVATVDQDGKVKAVGVGVANIIIKYNDSNYDITDTCKVTVIGLESVSIDSEEIEMSIGAGTTLSYDYAPKTFALDSTFVWSSSDVAVVTVDQDGKVKAVGVGVANIMIKYNDAMYDVKDMCEVTVIGLESVILSAEAISLEKGTDSTLTFIVAPEDVDADMGFAWGSTDEMVATVDAAGKVSAVGFGEAKISITYKDADNAVTDTCVITVFGPESVSLSENAVDMKVDSMLQLIYTVAPADLTLGSDFVWSTSDATVATVDADGNVKAIAAGTANVIITYDNANFEVSDTCEITVSEVSALYDNAVSLVALYPNPTQGMITVKGINEASQVIIYNLAGAQVMRTVVDVNYNQIDATSLKAGMYIVTVNNQNLKLQVK